jgi:hypothetical protein
MGRKGLGRQQGKRQDVGRALDAHVDAVELAKIYVVGQDQPDRGGRWSTSDVQRRGADPGQPRERNWDGDGDAGINAIPDRDVDPPRPDVDRPLDHAPVPVPVPRRDSISTILFWG